MTREEFYETAKVMDEAKKIIRALEVIELHLTGKAEQIICTSNDEERKRQDVNNMIQGLFMDNSEETMGVSVPKFLNYDYFLQETLSGKGKEIKIGDKNLLKAVKSRSLSSFAPEEMFVARDKFLNNLKKALEEVLAAIQLPKVEENK